MPWPVQVNSLVASQKGTGSCVVQAMLPVTSLNPGISEGAMVPEDATDCIWSSMNISRGPEPLPATLLRPCMVLLSGARAATAEAAAAVLDNTSIVLPNSLGISFPVTLAGGGSVGARGAGGGGAFGNVSCKVLVVGGGALNTIGGGGVRAALGGIGGKFIGGMGGDGADEAGGSCTPGGKAGSVKEGGNANTGGRSCRGGVGGDLVAGGWTPGGIKVGGLAASGARVGGSLGWSGSAGGALMPGGVGLGDGFGRGGGVDVGIGPRLTPGIGGTVGGITAGVRGGGGVPLGGGQIGLGGCGGGGGLSGIMMKWGNDEVSVFVYVSVSLFV